jgi:hypothetical protein
MNEKGLGMGESSCGAKSINYPANLDKVQIEGVEGVAAKIDLANLMQIGMERWEEN